jgi:hypothetical protein
MITKLSRTLLFNIATAIASVAAVTTAAAAPTKHALSVHDLLAMDRLQTPRVSPNGLRVVFGMSRTDLAQTAAAVT